MQCASAVTRPECAHFASECRRREAGAVLAAEVAAQVEQVGSNPARSICVLPKLRLVLHRVVQEVEVGEEAADLADSGRDPLLPRVTTW